MTEPSEGHHATLPLSPLRLLPLILGVALLTLFAVQGLRHIGVLEPLELVLYDHQLASLPPSPQPSPITLIEIDERDLLRLGWPVNDGLMAQAIDLLLVNGATTIGVDIYRNRPVEPGSERLESILGRGESVYWVQLFRGSDNEIGVAPPEALAGTRFVGFGDLVPDPGGAVRRALLHMDDGKKVATAFSLRLALDYLSHQGIRPQNSSAGLLRLGEGEIGRLQPDSGPYANLDAGGYQYLMDYRTAEPFPRIRISELLAGNFDPQLVRGRILMIGNTAVSGGDIFYTPYGWFDDQDRRNIHGIELHALMVDQLLRIAQGETAPLEEAGAAAQWAWGLLWGILGAILGLRVIGQMGYLYPLAGVALITLLGSLAMRHGLWLQLLPAILTFGMSFVITQMVLVQRIQRQRDFFEREHDEALRIANTDLLTGIANRRATYEQGEVERDRALRYGSPLSAIMFDIDHFKRVNDTYGHATGDLAIRWAARMGVEQLRAADTIGRVGGEEFLVLLPETNLAAARGVAERVRQAMEAGYVTGTEETVDGGLQLTASFGIAEMAEGNSLEDLVEGADQALYRAKNGGRNRVAD
jgi:diguanylate cyclase (GGDEF)-like protein